MRKMVLLFILFIIMQNLHGNETQITAKEVSLYFNPEYNRSFNFCWNLSGMGSIQLNNRYVIAGGLALGSVGDTFEIKGVVGGEVALPVAIPLYARLAYNYNGLPEYDVHTHSVLILPSLKWRWAGFAFGINFRFTSFFGEQAIFEPVITGVIYVNIINNDFLQLGLKLTNFDNFTCGNLASYFLALYSTTCINKRLSIINDIELHQSGSVALTSNFYGLVYRGGVAFTW